MAKLKVKRGTDAERLPVVFEAGEPVFTTDTKKLYIGDGQTPGGIPAGVLTTMMEWKGIWDSGYQYILHDTVYYNGGAWMALQSNINSQPAEDLNWTQLCQKGDQGIQGLKGDTGLGFAIKKTYVSVEECLADTNPTGIVNGEFAIINTPQMDDPSNSRLYLWNNGWTYTSDLSGAEGIKGDKGDKGFNWKGAWQNTDTYQIDDVVSYNGSSYISMFPNNQDHNPATGNIVSLGDTPTYSNSISSGDRTSLITVTAQGDWFRNGSLSYLVNGVISYSTPDRIGYNTVSGTDNAIVFYFNGVSKRVSEVVFVTENACDNGSWIAETSIDGTSWTAVSSSVPMTTTSTTFNCSSNVNLHKYIRLRLTSGTMQGVIGYFHEATFKAADLDATIYTPYWNLNASKGDKGEVGINFRGQYSSANTYAVGDTVTYNGSTYYAKLSSNSSSPVTPDENTVWTILSKIGNRGVTWKGQWTPNTSYISGDGVLFNGSSYVCKSDNTSDVIDTTTSIATMTSNTLPSGIVAADTSYDSSHLPYLAVDSSNTTYWNSTYSNPPHWWSYTFTTPKVIARYTIDVGTHAASAPKSWLFQGLSGVTWTTIETRSNITDWTTTKKTFDILNPLTFTSFRIYFNDANSSNGDIAIHNIEMFAMPGSNIPTNPAVWDLMASKGDVGKSFLVKKIYSSVASLVADTNPTNIEIDEFAMISTSTEDADNAKLFKWTGTGWNYIADLSGTSTHNELINMQGGIVGERYHLTQTQNSGLVNGNETTLHYHNTDRDRTNHTGTQLAATISDFQAAVEAIPVNGGYF